MPKTSPKTSNRKPRTRGNGEGTIYFDKSKGRYYAVVTVEMDASTGQPKKRIKVSGRTREEVAQKLADLLPQNNRGHLIMPDKTTVKGLLEAWLSWKADQIEPTTYCDYRNRINFYLIPALGDVPVQKLTRLQIEAAFKQMKQPRSTKNHKDFIPSESLLRSARTVLRLALREFAIERKQLIEKNPAEGVRLPRKLAREGRKWSDPPKLDHLSKAAT